MSLLKNKTIRRKVGLIYVFLIKVTFFLLEYMLPKDKNYWCFCTWQKFPHTMDNPRAIFEVVKNDPDITKIVLFKDSGVPSLEGVNVKFIDAESFKGAYYVARSKVILLGYSIAGLASYASLLTTRHSIVQLWHGIPLKRIGMLFPEETFWPAETAKYAATVCSSPSDKNFMEQVFSPIDKSRVWQSGLPRNDIILMDENKLPGDYLAMLQDVRERVNGRRLVLYVPTWRIDSANRYDFSDKELADLDKVLEKYDAVLAIRGHSNVRANKLMDLQDNETRIIDVSNVPDVNILLRLTDVLITDYSSIYIDFLVTEKPILHFTYDLEEYYKERGFLYDIDDAFASKEVLSFDQLLGNLDETLSMGIADVDRYQRVKVLFHEYSENGSAGVVENIKNIG